MNTEIDTPRKSLTFQIMAGLVLGAVVGSLIPFLQPGFFRDTFLLEGVLDLVGGLFINSIKMLVVPLVFVSLICGVASLGDIRRLGRIGTRTIAFYLVTTGLAISLALLTALLINSGKGIGPSKPLAAETTIAEKPSLIKNLQNIIPSNPVSAMAEGNMLQIIFAALLAGSAITMCQPRSRVLIDFFLAVNEVILKMVTLMLYLAPYGVFALMAKTFATNGSISLLLVLFKYSFSIILALALHMIVVYMSALKLMVGVSPVKFFKNYLPAMGVAFSTASSNATLPVSLETVEHRCGVSNGVAAFTMPLGATINMDGTAIMQGVAVVFISQVYGIELSLYSYLTVIITATLASIGTAGVPGVGLVTLAMVLDSVGLPVSGIAMIIGVDRLLDMARTVVNITGDAVVSIIVAKTEGEFNQEIFDTEHVTDSFK